MRFCLLILVLTAALQAAEQPPLPAGFSESEQRIVVAYREWLDEVAHAEAKFQGTLEVTDGPFRDLGKVDFILQQTGDWPRRYLHDRDHDLIFSAVRGQSDAELEANLPAIIHYVRLAVASRTYHWKARHQLPLVGKRRGLDRVIAIAKQVYDFRTEQIERIKAGSVPPSQVLTRANIGELGDPKLLADLRGSFVDGQNQFTNQRNSVLIGVFAIEVGISFLIAIVFLRRRRPVTVLGATRPLPAEA
ncbi:MAG: hypothetical protein H6509_01315 [Bryobacterales bacterium]|nr:hypothetical protein [Bryobacterales bacterium]